MSYLPLDEYNRKWIFTHQSMPVDDEVLPLIKPFTQAKSAQVWNDFISANSPTADHFGSKEWPMKKSSWSNEIDWQHRWDSDNESLPEEVLEFIDWADEVTIYFCYEKYNVIETSWGTFKKTWKNFLFYDDLPILIGKKKSQALWFNSKGKVKLGSRS
ncbi:DUF2947 domain-containing protein [Aliivibrio wodanis]|uniref:DUF2947 domain-containing protein n=1 Tax=Aliivibrio wodanis TaxID=80852 RepID=A0A090IMM1_9GAMM|nr:putative uncharacterized protein [Aliivibrio wodanis]VVV04351.1 hypothetical protein AW0309160_01735 [Aliivibrio wodanis]